MNDFNISFTGSDAIPRKEADTVVRSHPIRNFYDSAVQKTKAGLHAALDKVDPSPDAVMRRAGALHEEAAEIAEKLRFRAEESAAKAQPFFEARMAARAARQPSRSRVAAEAIRSFGENTVTGVRGAFQHPGETAQAAWRAVGGESIAAGVRAVRTDPKGAARKTGRLLFEIVVAPNDSAQVPVARLRVPKAHEPIVPARAERVLAPKKGLKESLTEFRRWPEDIKAIGDANRHADAYEAAKQKAEKLARRVETLSGIAARPQESEVLLHGYEWQEFKNMAARQLHSGAGVRLDEPAVAEGLRAKAGKVLRSVRTRMARVSFELPDLAHTDRGPILRKRRLLMGLIPAGSEVFGEVQRLPSGGARLIFPSAMEEKLLLPRVLDTAVAQANNKLEKAMPEPEFARIDVQATMRSRKLADERALNELGYRLPERMPNPNAQMYIQPSAEPALVLERDTQAAAERARLQWQMEAEPLQDAVLSNRHMIQVRAKEAEAAARKYSADWSEAIAMNKSFDARKAIVDWTRSTAHTVEEQFAHARAAVAEVLPHRAPAAEVLAHSAPVAEEVQTVLKLAKPRGIIRAMQRPLFQKIVASVIAVPSIILGAVEATRLHISPKATEGALAFVEREAAAMSHSRQVIAKTVNSGNLVTKDVAKLETVTAHIPPAPKPATVKPVEELAVATRPAPVPDSSPLPAELFSNSRPRVVLESAPENVVQSRVIPESTPEAIQPTSQQASATPQLPPVPFSAPNPAPAANDPLSTSLLTSSVPSDDMLLRASESPATGTPQRATAPLKATTSYVERVQTSSPRAQQSETVASVTTAPSTNVTDMASLPSVDISSPSGFVAPVIGGVGGAGVTYAAANLDTFKASPNASTQSSDGTRADKPLAVKSETSTTQLAATVHQKHPNFFRKMGHLLASAVGRSGGDAVGVRGQSM